jgi:predicted unusual protein kinase regulating ubiquinone biosynthesis (AarF/ABC1/UbiB family)
MADDRPRERPIRRRGSEDATLAGRVRRYARVGTAMGGLAARMAGDRYLGIKLDREKHAADLRAALGGVKGPLMKAAQLLSTIPDALPPEYARELAHLQADAPPMGWPFVRRRMASELGPDWQQRFASFGHTAAHAASLGQVHRATLPDGRVVACKLQYPDMASAVEADLRQLRLIFSLYERYDRAISTERIHAEIAARLREELDYDRERRHMEMYRAMLAGEPTVHVPKPVPALSTRRLLTMTWLEGEPIARFIDGDPPAEARNRAAMALFRAWYVPFYDYGVIHGDPHLGNYTVRSDQSLNLLDFGCIRIFQPPFVGGVIDLYFGVRDGDRGRAAHAYEVWGFRNLNAEMIDTLNIWARFVFAPILEDKTRRIEETNATAYGADVAAKVHSELRRIGGVTPPREFVFMDRAAIGLGAVFLRLNAEINWYRLFHDLIGNFDEAALARRQAEAMAAVGLEMPE